MNLRREDITKLLRGKLDEANAAYQRAQQEYRGLMAIVVDTASPGNPASRDGTYALHKAMRLQEQARLKYQHALKDFTDFVVHGKLPENLRD